MANAFKWGLVSHRSGTSINPCVHQYRESFDIANELAKAYNHVLTERIPDDMRRLIEGLR